MLLRRPLFTVGRFFFAPDFGVHNSSIRTGLIAFLLHLFNDNTATQRKP